MKKKFPPNKKLDFVQEEVKSALMNEHKDDEGKHPTEFNGKSFQFQENVTKDMYNVNVKVIQVSKSKYHVELREKKETFEYVLVYNPTKVPHAVYLDEYDIRNKKATCINSFPDDPTPTVNLIDIEHLYRISCKAVKTQNPGKSHVSRLSLHEQYKKELAEKTLQLQVETEKCVKAEQRIQDLENINDMLEEERQRLQVELQDTKKNLKQALEENAKLQQINLLLKKPQKDEKTSRNNTNLYRSSPNLLPSHFQDIFSNGQRARTSGQEREQTREEKNEQKEIINIHPRRRRSNSSFRWSGSSPTIRTPPVNQGDRETENVFNTNKYRSSPNLLTSTHSQHQIYHPEPEEQNVDEEEAIFPPRRPRALRFKCIIL